MPLTTFRYHFSNPASSPLDLAKIIFKKNFTMSVVNTSLTAEKVFLIFYCFKTPRVKTICSHSKIVLDLFHFDLLMFGFILQCPHRHHLSTREKFFDFYAKILPGRVYRYLIYLKYFFKIVVFKFIYLMT